MSGSSRCSTAASAGLLDDRARRASSDARNISTSIVRDGDKYVVNGRKWWTTGAADPRCKLLIVMGKIHLSAPANQQHSMILVPLHTPGVTVMRTLPLYGFWDQQGHCEINYENVRVPAANILGGEGKASRLLRHGWAQDEFTTVCALSACPSEPWRWLPAASFRVKRSAESSQIKA